MAKRSPYQNKLQDTPRIKTEILPALGSAKQLTASTTSANIALTATGLRGVRLTARLTGVRFNIGTGSVVASSTAHYLPQDGSVEFAVINNTVVAAMSDTATAGVLEITELK